MTSVTFPPVGKLIRACHAPRVTSKSAAARGAILAVAWATALFSLLAAVKTVQHGHGLLALADPLFERDTFDASPAYVIGASLVAAALVGAAMGRLGRRLTSPPPVRVAVLTLASLPALFGVIWLALSIIAIPSLWKDGVVAVLLAPVGALLYAAYGIVFAAPVAWLPSVLAGLMLEGWTRPEARPQRGLASPRLRRWTLHVLVAAIAAFTTFAVLRWPRA